MLFFFIPLFFVISRPIGFSRILYLFCKVLIIFALPQPISSIFVFLLNLTLAKIIASVVFENSNRILGLFMSFVKAQIYILVFILIIIDTSFANSILDKSYLAPYYLYFIEYIFLMFIWFSSKYIIHGSIYFML